MIYCQHLAEMPLIPSIFHSVPFLNVTSIRRDVFVLSKQYNIYLNLSGNGLTSFHIEVLVIISHLLLPHILDVSNNQIAHINTD